MTSEESDFISSTGDIQRLIEEEGEAVEMLKRKSQSSADAALRSLYARMAEVRASLCTELETYLREVRPSTEITSQINEMFR